MQLKGENKKIVKVHKSQHKIVQGFQFHGCFNNRQIDKLLII
jgi:hypothetical protein